MSSHAAASATGRPRPRRRSNHCRPPRHSYPRPDLLLPQLDRVVIALDRATRGLLPRPAVPPEEAPRALHRVRDVEEATDQLLTRAKVHRWSAQPCASGPRSNSRSSLATWASLSLGRPGDPFEATPAAPPSRHCRRHRSTDLSDTRRAPAMTWFLSPASNRVTASRRTRSRAALSASVKPPPCAYLTMTVVQRSELTAQPNDPTSPNQVQ